MNTLKNMADGQTVFLGNEINAETNQPTDNKIGLLYRDRFFHSMIIGPVGSGKSSLVVGPMLKQDVDNNDIGVIVLDPIGNTARDTAAYAKYRNRTVIYFNPLEENSVYFNPLMGNEEEVIDAMTKTFNMLNETDSLYFKDCCEELLRNSIKLVKRVFGNRANLDHLLAVMTNEDGQGKMWTTNLSKSAFDPVNANDNQTVISYFYNDYYTGIGGDRKGTMTFMNCSAIRVLVKRMVSNKYLRKVLIPPENAYVNNMLNIDDVLENGDVLCICSANRALGETAKYLGLLLMNAISSAVFRRSESKSSGKGVIMYMDECHSYETNGLSDLILHGREYNVALVMTAQSRVALEEHCKGNRNLFLEDISSCVKNIVLMPACSVKDARYYSEEFGDPRFTSETIQYLPYGTAICRLVKDNTIQRPVLVDLTADTNKEIKDVPPLVGEEPF